mmetsp:Transcript_76159/g.240841  ORF Transcript_76159/g.240841 Transcript_76159/m.240841 type:complete len:204 (-) Transcript_76159:155-766(-)
MVRLCAAKRSRKQRPVMPGLESTSTRPASVASTWPGTNRARPIQAWTESRIWALSRRTLLKMSAALAAKASSARRRLLHASRKAARRTIGDGSPRRVCTTALNSRTCRLPASGARSTSRWLTISTAAKRTNAESSCRPSATASATQREPTSCTSAVQAPWRPSIACRRTWTKMLLFPSVKSTSRDSVRVRDSALLLSMPSSWA